MSFVDDPAIAADAVRPPRKDGAPASKRVSHRWIRPVLIVFAAIGVGAVATTIGPLRDVDVFWHTRLGQELSGGASIYDVANNWSYAPVTDHWVSTQWVVELLFGWLNSLWGWNGLVAFRVVTTAIALCTLAYAVLRQTRAWAALVAYCLGVFSLVIFSQERPQQISFILLPLVGLMWLRSVRDGRIPRWWTVLLVCVVWANCHGLWILVPLSLALAAIGRLCDNGRKDPVAAKLGLLTVVALIGGCVTPIGPANLWIPFVFADSTDQILEWDPTSLIAVSSAGLTITALLLVWAWARGKIRPSRAEVIFCAVMILFGVSAGRNVTPAVLILAPVLAWRLTAAFNGPRRRPAPTGLVSIAAPSAAIIAVVGAAFIAFTMSVSHAVPPAGKAPIALIDQIAKMPGGARVLNNYNVSGPLLWYSLPGAVPGRNEVQVGIDGRADRYGGTYINEYLNMTRGKPGWDKLVNELNPNVALLSEEDQLVPLLLDRGWREVGREDKHVLLLPPTRTS